MNAFEFFEDMQAKQHINLSVRAWDIIEQDNMEFLHSGPDKISGFINRVLEVYLKEGLYPADITSLILSYEEQQKAWLKEIQGLSDGQIHKIVYSLKTKYMESLLLSFSKAKGIGRKFDVNNECRFLLKEKGESGYEVEVFQKRGTYIKAIMEHYASLPMAEREDIFFSERINELNYCIRANRVIYLTGVHRSGALIPYKIMHDKYNMHTYLIAVPYEKMQHQSYLFRISQIQQLTRAHITAEPITKDTIQLLENEIKQKGVQYLPGQAQKILVKLTPTGQSMYHRITFQRPAYEPQTSEEMKENVFTFTCTPYQIYVYFKAFGAEAEVLAPKELREQFIQFYEKGLEIYKK